MRRSWLHSTIKVLEHIPSTKTGWAERSKYVLPLVSPSMEYLWGQREKDNTSIGIIKPKEVQDFIIEEDEPDWPEEWKMILKQLNLLGPNRKPLPKVPFKFSYKFLCDDERCKKGHTMMVSDWEVGALYNNMISKGLKPIEAAAKVRTKFFDQLCSERFNTHFYVGTTLRHRASWIIIGLFYPKKKKQMGLWQSTPDR
ncbi:MAG: hypothetical protein U9Q76_05010 [candidate division WOR-3 bacterium]|nr:hypothetical protein [candidate division WOR-3 bacterium]